MEKESNVLLDETTEIEKKQAVERKKVRNWLKSISAFANTAGGILVFGISDDNQIVGLDDIKSDSEFISQKIKERISPFPEVVMKCLNVEQKTLLLVSVPKGTDTPYYYMGDGVMEAYIRIGNESVIANVTEVKRLVMKGSNLTYDAQISPHDFEDFSFSKVRERYRRWTGKSMSDKSFESFGIRNAEGKLTNAGALLADDSPIWWSRLFCTRWNGLDKSGGIIDALDSEEYTGSLIILLNEGMAFVKRNMKTRWKKIPDSRIEMPEYCERGVFEALVNALIHRDYMINGSEVHIDMFDDRLVIYSPGGMADGSQIQEHDIDEIPSVRRNPVLADIFSRLGYMERQGSGLNKICLVYEHAVNYQDELRPVFFSNRSGFWVTLLNLNYNIPEESFREVEITKETTKEIPKNSKETAEITKETAEITKENIEITKETAKEIAERMLRLIKENPNISTNEMSKQLGISVYGVRYRMKKLKGQGILEHIGSTKKGQWIVK